MHVTSMLLNSIIICKFDEEKQLYLFGQPMHQKLPLHMHSKVHVTSQLMNLQATCLLQLDTATPRNVA